MTVLLLIASIAAFCAVLHLGRAPKLAMDAIATAQFAAHTIASPEISDDEKGRRVRRASLRLFGSFAAIAVISLAALAAAGAIVWLGAAAGLYELEDAISVASGWPFILSTSVALVLAWILWQSAKRRNT